MMGVPGVSTMVDMPGLTACLAALLVAALPVVICLLVLKLSGVASRVARLAEAVDTQGALEGWRMEA